MQYSIGDYDRDSQEFEKQEAQRFQAEKLKLKKIADAMTSDDHLKVLEAVFKGHLGAQRITITYDPPCFQNQDRIVLTTELSNQLKRRGWLVNIGEDWKVLIISNFHGNRLDGADYDEYPYRKFKNKGSKTIIDFLVPLETNNKTIETLMLFKDHIRVRLWDLLVPEDRICKVCN